jgi:26S proteasome regulatory subunit (ATPase 3-interacting protein)
MHGRVKKPQCQKILDDLTDSKFLTCKEYGKAKIYLANQDNFPATSTEELTKIDEKIKVLKEQLAANQQKLKDLQSCIFIRIHLIL